MIYRMISSVAEFCEEYRTLKEIVLDSDAMAGAGKSDFEPLKRMEEKATFHTNPACLDAFSQLAGFIMNANSRSNLEVEVFVNHGWESLQLFEPIMPDNPYECFVHMTKKEGSVWQGSVVILRGDRVAGRFINVTVSFVNLRRSSPLDQTKRIHKIGTDIISSFKAFRSVCYITFYL